LFTPGTAPTRLYGFGHSRKVDSIAFVPRIGADSIGPRFCNFMFHMPFIAQSGEVFATPNNFLAQVTWAPGPVRSAAQRRHNLPDLSPKGNSVKI
jgi:hypothetical protein